VDTSSTVTQLLNNAVADSTRTVYNSAFEAYCKFIKMNNIPYYNNMPPVSEQLLISFVSHCFKNLKLAYSTIKLYLAGIKFKYLVAGEPSPFYGAGGTGENLLRLQMVLKGVQRSTISKCRKRLPVTRDMLHVISSRLRLGFFSLFTDRMLETVCIVAFFAFLRCGEFTCKANFDPSVNLTIGDISFHENYAVLTLKQSKTDPFRRGVDIKLFCVGSSLCPKCLLQNYLKLRTSVFPNWSDLDSCFVNKTGEPLSRVEFLTLFKQILSACGFEADSYSGHSFRSGAATSAASAKIEDHLIKVLGRWSSDSYCRYIKTPANTLHSAQLAMSRI
jgi:hypothetical protein